MNAFVPCRVPDSDNRDHVEIGYDCVRAANPKPVKGTKVTTISKKQSKKPKSKLLSKPKRAAHPDRKELEGQLSPQEEETYIARLRAASEHAGNDVKNAMGEWLDDE
jgi:hypothetical protein